MEPQRWVQVGDRSVPGGLHPSARDAPQTPGWLSSVSAAAHLCPQIRCWTGCEGPGAASLEGGQLPMPDPGHPELIPGPLGSLGPRLCQHKGDFVPSSSSSATAAAAGDGVTASRGVRDHPGGLCHHPRGLQVFGGVCGHLRGSPSSWVGSCFWRVFSNEGGSHVLGRLQPSGGFATFWGPCSHLGVCSHPEGLHPLGGVAVLEGLKPSRVF